jgi:Tol biopolymer transport system component
MAPDGRRIAFSVEDSGRTLLYAIDNDGSDAKVLSDSLLLRGNPSSAPDGQSIVSGVVGEIGHKNFSLLDLRTGAQRMLAGLPADFVIRDFDISADGSEAVFDRVRTNSNLALIDRTR